MNPTIRKVCSMLQGSDGMRRCAAAMVLAELAPRDDAVVKALGRALADANHLLTRYILEAFESIGTRSVVPFVLPLLNVEDVETKLRAAAIVARIGGDVVDELREQFIQATPVQKRVLVDILARIHSREAYQLILGVLDDPDFELVREACHAVHRHIGSALAKDRRTFHNLVVKLLNQPRVKHDERVVSSCLLLIGYIGALTASDILIKYAAQKRSASIRHHALLGLRGLDVSAHTVTKVAPHLISFLGDQDYANIVMPSLDIAEKLSFPPRYETQWRKLLKSEHPPVRVFAARKISHIDNARTPQLLIALLKHDDVQVVEIAAGALSRNKRAVPFLLKALRSERDSEHAWRLAKILKPYTKLIDKKTGRAISAIAVRHLTSGDARYEALLYFLRNLDQTLADKVWRDAGQKFKQANKWEKAIDCYRQLARGEGFNNDDRYQLSICSLKRSPKELSVHYRSDDQSLRGFQSLLQEKNNKLLAKLQKEQSLDLADLFYVGFHFCEGTGEEFVFGKKLLEHLMRRSPNSKVGKAARSKLKIVSEK